MAIVDIERVADVNGLRPQVRAVMFGTGFVFTSVPAGVLEGSPEAPGSVTGYERIDATASGVVTTAAVQAAIAGQPITPAQVTTGGNITVGGALSVAGDVTVGGLVIEGGGVIGHGSATTSGTGSATLSPLAIPMPDNSVVSLSLSVTAIDLTSGALTCMYQAGGVVLAGSLAAGIDGSPSIMSFGLPPHVDLAWAASFLAVVVSQPRASIVGTSDSGGTATLITCAEEISNDITGRSVTISGATGTPGLNGAHGATYSGPNEFTVPVVYVAPDASGTVRLTVAPTIKWQCLAIGTVGAG